MNNNNIGNPAETGLWNLDTGLAHTGDISLKPRPYFPVAATCLLNDPTLVNNFTSHHCAIQGCACAGNLKTSNGILSHTEDHFLRLGSADLLDTDENHKIQLPSQLLIKEPDKFKVEERPYKCEQPNCNKTFLLKHHLANHEKIHTGERPHVCKHCGKSFTHKYCLNTHLVLHTKERPHQCSECNKRFTLKHHLISHINVHKRERPFFCGECGKNFPLKKQLITHEKYHRGERPFVCKECGDTFAQENHLVMHLRFHGSTCPYVCRDCGATFTRKFELDNHERLHGKEPLVCGTCNKEFLQKRTLMQHLKTHETKTCRYCGEQFPKPQNSNESFVHFCSGDKKSQLIKPGVKQKTLKVPKPNKKFFCDICFRKFGAKHGLTQHKKRQHSIGGNIFSCHICSKSFRDKNELINHKHNIL
ncbi:zinc finger protein OZF-like [Anthonomus grandis grandis]|uniref:zinc finger protein OZF-like n=1 Tax=Anthonomus grandis grandis TaxID=2921223 RepID=UPI002164F302|nr:zinc finger protein OZF-like [Anthonomus grandis grandis]